MKTTIGFVFLSALLHLSVGQPDNSVCEDAESLDIGDDPVYGSTEEAEENDDLEGCGDNRASDFIGVWYSVTGDGNALTASLCSSEDSYDTQITVYGGSCDELECIAGNDDECGGLSEVTWPAEDGEEYFVFVHGFQGATGNFEIAVETAISNFPTSAPVPTPSPTDPPEPLENDSCFDAIELEVDDLIQGTTEGATEDGELSVCGDNRPQTDYLGVWYVIEGEGDALIASLCPTPDYLDETYDTQITIYRSSSDSECADLECVAGDDDGCGNELSEVAWQAEDGVDYYIYVHGLFDETGPFILTVFEADTNFPTSTPIEPTSSSPSDVPTPAPEPPENDECEDSIELELDDGTTTVSGDTSTATPKEDLESCDGNRRSDFIGVWYTIEGDGRVLTASTCDDDTEFDTQLTIYYGSDDGRRRRLDGHLDDFCENLECVGGNDDDEDCDASDDQSTVSWYSEDDVVYFIFVHGFGGETGEFTLTVEAEEAPEPTPTPSAVPSAVPPPPTPTRQPTPRPTPPPQPTTPSPTSDLGGEALGIIDNMVGLMTDMVGVLPQMLELMGTIVGDARRALNPFN